MAPPKRKTTGARDAEGHPARRRGGSQRGVVGRRLAEPAVGASARYTPPVAEELDESPRWVPILMFVLIGSAGLIILLRYIVWPDSNLPVLIGLGFLLAGLYTATKWR